MSTVLMFGVFIGTKFLKNGKRGKINFNINPYIVKIHLLNYLVTGTKNIPVRKDFYENFNQDGGRQHITVEYVLGSFRCYTKKNFFRVVGPK